MSLPAAAARRPVTVLVGTISLTVFGLLAAERLPVELLPDISYPTLTVQTSYPDAAPVSVEQLVTRPIEEAVGVIAGVRDLRSVSRAGSSEVVLELEWGEPVDLAALDVREKLGLVELPRECELPRVLRFDPSLDPVVRLALGGERPLDALRQLADRWLKPRLEAIRGVAAAKVRGGLEPEVTVEVDEDKLAALGLAGDDLAAAIQAEAVDSPGGELRDGGAVLLVRTLHELTEPAQLARTIVRDRPTGRVRLEDVAQVRRGSKDATEVARVAVSGRAPRQAVELALHREGSANTLAVSREVAAELARLRTELPPDLELIVLTDQAGFIGAAIDEVWENALVGGLLSILVLWFFLRDLRPTFVIAITIPVSIVATFLGMGRAGVSLNIMSLGGLALGIGMLVDCAIVVLEAIDRQRALGLSRFDAACAGSSEVAAAVAGSALTTIAVFLPVVFVEGVAGQLFYDLSVTVCLSLAFSLLFALTLVPALAALEPMRLLSATAAAPTGFAWDAAPKDGARPGSWQLGPLLLPPLGDGVHWASRLLTALARPAQLVLAVALALVAGAGWLFARTFDVVAWPLARAFDATAAAYPGVIRRALGRRWLVLLVVLGLFLGSVAWLPRLGATLVPDLAQGEFAFRLRLPEGTPLETTAQLLEQVEGPLSRDPRLLRVFSVAGSLPSTASGRQTLGENLAQLDVVVAPPPGEDEVDGASEAAAVERVRAVLAGFEGLEAELVHPSVLSVTPPVEVLVHGEELAALDAGALTVARALSELEGVRDVATTVEPGSPEVEVVVDRERAAALGVTPTLLGETLRRQIHGQVVGRMREDEERVDIRLRAAARFRDRAASVEGLRIRLPGGSIVPASAVATVKVGRGPAAVHRQGGQRVARVTAQVSASDLGPALDRVRAALATLRLRGGATAELSGQDEELRASARSLRLALALALFLVFVVMAIEFESLVHPFVILITVPLGLIGVVAGLALVGLGLSALALMGVVILAGVVVDNGIVLIDAVNRRRDEGQPLDDALAEAGAERLRPILMTTGTTVLGLLPMAFGIGAGVELRRPLAVTIVAGLTVATVLTLVVIPCVYRILARPSAGLRQGVALGEEPPRPGEPA